MLLNWFISFTVFDTETGTVRDINIYIYIYIYILIYIYIYKYIYFSS